MKIIIILKLKNKLELVFTKSLFLVKFYIRRATQFRLMDLTFISTI